MYAINHTTHTLISLSEHAEENVRERFKNFSAKDKTLFGRCIIKQDRISFFDRYEAAKAFQALLYLHGGF